MVQLWAKKARFLISLLKTNGWSIFKCKNGWSMAHVNWRSAKSKVHGTAGQREKCWCLHQIAKTEQEQRVASWERETESWLRAEIAGHVLKALQVNCVDQQRWKAGCWAEGLMLTLGKPLPLSGEVERGKSSTGSQVEEDGRKKGPSLAKYQGASRMQLLYSLHSFP